jgi:hypothetical protein
MGQYSPETSAGKSLLAHELTHVLQQTGGWRPGNCRPQAAPATNIPSRGSGFEVEDAIRYIEKAIAAAAISTDDDILTSGQRTKISIQTNKLKKALVQLRHARGTDGQGIVFGFSVNPIENEIIPGDANRSVKELFGGIDPYAQTSDSLEKTAPGSVVLQAKMQPGGLIITPLIQPQIQRFCDPLVCLGIIILAGLLFSGCTRRSSKPCPKKKKIVKEVHVFELAGRALNPRTEMEAASKYWMEMAGIDFRLHYHAPINEADTRKLIGTGYNEGNLPISSISLDYTTNPNGTEEMRNLRILREGKISIFFTPKISYIAPSAIDPRLTANIVYVGMASTQCPGTGIAVAHEIGHLLLGPGHSSEWDSPLMSPSRGCMPQLTELECRMARGDDFAIGEYYQSRRR